MWRVTQSVTNNTSRLGLIRRFGDLSSTRFRRYRFVGSGFELRKFEVIDERVLLPLNGLDRSSAPNLDYYPL